MSVPIEFDGADRAAVMVMLLGEEDAARLLAGLSPEELRTLGAKMCEMGEIGPSAIADAIVATLTRASGEAAEPNVLGEQR